MKQQLAILGSGISGLGSAILGVRQSWSVFVSDSGSIKAETKNKLTKIGVDFEENTHSIEKLLKADLVVKSPGIPQTAPVVQQLLAAVIPEAESISGDSLSSGTAAARVLIPSFAEGLSTSPADIGRSVIDAAICFRESFKT